MDRCTLCSLDDKNEHLYGDWIDDEGVKVHYFCLLSSTNLPQKGTSKGESGLRGFRKKDIEACALNHRKTECHYCGRLSATVSEKSVKNSMDSRSFKHEFHRSTALSTAVTAGGITAAEPEVPA
jgi:hypothetical protein